MLGTATGGTAGHVAMLAAGCAAQGHQVTVYGPARTARFFPAAGFAPVDIGDRPRPGRDLAAMLRLRGLLRFLIFSLIALRQFFAFVGDFRL